MATIVTPLTITMYPCIGVTKIVTVHPTTETHPFIDLAKTLLTKRVLQIGPRVYEFTEIEFYRYDEKHPDPYTHRHPDQLQYGKFYFHRSSNSSNASYKGGTYKGLDISLGDGSKSYCAILIRSIYNPDTGMICGPCNVVDHILASCDVKSIDELVGPSALDISNNHRMIHVRSPEETKTSIASSPIYCGPRIGLGSHSPEWQKQPYRFVRRYADGKMKAKRTLSLIP